ncbi:unnamed protein product [Haemonchus placei]|uniref:C-type lectin domain-containing protein n=1 Tax=Haemonchus placei TaxID=6290 RepID=A0A0N4VVK7_HAEPC|nr:unnamed protein product [Haemonchus placei]
MKVGIYTNKDDWTQITNGAKVNNAMLWYWSVKGPGSANMTQPDFNDFTPFAGWTAPSVKQFVQSDTLCGVTLNRNVYDTSIPVNSLRSKEKSDRISSTPIPEKMKKKSLKMAWAAFMLSVVASHIVETYASEGLLDPFPELTLKFTNTEPLTLRQHRKSQVDPSLPHPNNVDSPTSPEQPLNKNVSTAKSVDSESDEESSGDAVATFFKNFAEKVSID